MGIVAWMVAGFIIAFLARMIIPEFAQGNFLVTVLSGTAGAALGGFFVRLIGGNRSYGGEPVVLPCGGAGGDRSAAPLRLDRPT
jgi:uncharacterized membrane protein YeaQ/YmgE (transglycosylase-associated protein family)